MKGEVVTLKKLKIVHRKEIPQKRVFEIQFCGVPFLWLTYLNLNLIFFHIIRFDNSESLALLR